MTFSIFVKYTTSPVFIFILISSIVTVASTGSISIFISSFKDFDKPSLIFSKAFLISGLDKSSSFLGFTSIVILNTTLTSVIFCIPYLSSTTSFIPSSLSVFSMFLYLVSFEIIVVSVSGCGGVVGNRERH